MDAAIDVKEHNGSGTRPAFDRQARGFRLGYNPVRRSGAILSRALPAPSALRSAIHGGRGDNRQWAMHCRQRSGPILGWRLQDVLNGRVQ